MPGARIHDWAGTSSGAMRCVARRCGAAYIVRLMAVACSANCLTRDVCCHTSCEIATSAPPASAPSRMCWIVGARWPASVNICGRERASFTGRPGTARAAMTASTVGAWTTPLDPNPPPTNGAVTWTSSVASPNRPAIDSRTPWTLCVDS